MTDRSVIYDAANDRYIGVHRWRKPGHSPRWRAALVINDRLVELASFQSREDAADRVVAYFKERYGRNWARVVAARTSGGGMHLTRIRKAGGAYMADVWLCNTPVTATPAMVRDRRGAAGKGWATKADARRAVHELKRRLGAKGDNLNRPHLLRLADAVA